MDIGLLEQSLVRVDGNPTDALAESIKLARSAEDMGYSRIWVSEHHDSAAIAGSSPEILLAALGAATNTIRLGSGGVMLPHYSPYKVAENFAVLSNLYPGRVDLGVGRAPGADLNAAVALATDGKPKFERFPELVRELIDALNNRAYSPRVTPKPVLPLPVWILGSSAESALLAAQLGLPYSVALFINPQFDPQLISLYKQKFRPSTQCLEPRVMISLQVFAAETVDEAAALSHAASLSFVRFVTRQGSPGTIAPEEAIRHRFSSEEESFVTHMARGKIVGVHEQLQDQVSIVKERFQADEILAVCNSYYFHDRVASFDIFSKAMGLNRKEDFMSKTVVA